MRIDPTAIPVRDMYRMLIGVITPRPIAWVSTVSPRGIPNLAPFSFFNGVAANPPTVVFSPVNRRDGSKKDTILNIEQTPEFVVNVVSYDLARPMNDSSAELPYEESEFDACGLTPLPSEKVKPPRVKEAKVHMECVLHQIVNVGEGPLAANLVIGRIVLMHVDEAVLGADGLPDPFKLDTIGRMGGEGYARTRELFELPRPGGKR
ncbi:MAG: flavin reductase family protein [Planctomycetota bacterium]|nr:flavin reductase family protein [Planctomycetota bacterium]